MTVEEIKRALTRSGFTSGKEHELENGTCTTIEVRQYGRYAATVSTYSDGKWSVRGPGSYWVRGTIRFAEEWAEISSVLGPHHVRGEEKPPEK